MATENRSANKSRAGMRRSLAGGAAAVQRSAEPVAARRLIPVAEAGLDVDPPRGLGDKRRLRPADQAAERREIGGVVKRGHLVEVAGVPPQLRELGQVTLGHARERVV